MGIRDVNFTVCACCRRLIGDILNSTIAAFVLDPTSAFGTTIAPFTGGRSGRVLAEMSLLPFFEWCEHTAVGAAIRGSAWLFPVIEAFHLLALALIGGAILIVDLRLLGLGLR